MNDLEMLSIIVPFYNSEDFLDDCIKSIITQRYNNIELILVNDGSVDKSEDICKRYQNIDDRVKYYKFNTNRGVSFARNFGIMKSTGKYITFVDSDDYLDKDIYISFFHKSCNYFDFGIFDVIDINGDLNNKRGLNINSGLSYKDELIPNQLFEIAGAVHRCIYLKELILSYNLTFSNNLVLSEDRVFNLKYLHYAKNIVYCPDSVYFRIVHPNSTVHKYRVNLFNEVKEANLQIEETVLTYWSKEYLLPYNYSFCYSYISCVKNILRSENKDTVLKKIKSIKLILTDRQINETFKNCSDNDQYLKIYRDKKIPLIIIINIIEKYYSNSSKLLVKKIWGKLLQYYID